MFEVIIAIAIIIVAAVIKAIILFVRYSFAQHQVNKAYKSLTRWNRRLEWAIEDGSWVDADNYEWSAEVLAEVVEARKAAFNKAVDSRDLIRF